MKNVNTPSTSGYNRYKTSLSAMKTHEINTIIKAGKIYIAIYQAEKTNKAVILEERKTQTPERLQFTMILT